MQAVGANVAFRSKHRGRTIFGRPLLCIGRVDADNNDDDDDDGDDHDHDDDEVDNHGGDL